MMGKGKSSIITPLLSLYFKIVYGKKIYIIVPRKLIRKFLNLFIKILKID